MPHPNEDIIRAKLKELRSIGLNLPQQKLLNEVEDLLDDRPRLLYLAKEYFPNESK